MLIFGDSDYQLQEGINLHSGHYFILIAWWSNIILQYKLNYLFTAKRKSLLFFTQKRKQIWLKEKIKNIFTPFNPFASSQNRGGHSPRLLHCLHTLEDDVLRKFDDHLIFISNTRNITTPVRSPGNTSSVNVTTANTSTQRQPRDRDSDSGGAGAGDVIALVSSHREELLDDMELLVERDLHTHRAFRDKLHDVQGRAARRVKWAVLQVAVVSARHAKTVIAKRYRVWRCDQRRLIIPEFPLL